MRRIFLLAAACCAAYAAAAPRSDKDTPFNTRYQESAAEKAAAGFQEADLPLPAFPDPRSGNWFDIYVSNTFAKKPKILLDSITVAPDRSVRYVLNTQSAQGHDNLSSEGIYCAESSFGGEGKRSSYKIFGYGDPVNKRWITPRQGEWKSLGSALNSTDPIRGALWRAFCQDGLPKNAQTIRERVVRHAGSRPTSATNRDK